MHHRYFGSLKRTHTDSLIVLIAVAGIFMILEYVDGFEALYTFTRQHEEFELDEVLLIVLAAPLPIAWFAYRRARDTVREATRRIELEKALAHSRKLESLGTLAGGVAHEINSQLIPVMTMAEIVRDHMPETNPDRQKLNLVLAGAEGAKRTVSKILDFSRAGGGDVKTCNATSTGQSVKDILLMTCPANVQLDVSIGDKMGNVPISTDEFQSILVNLFSNAIGSLESKAGNVSVVVSATRLDTKFTGRNLAVGDYVEITVTDTGKGITPTDKEHLFDPFFSTKQAGEGLGLGLSILHGIIVAAGGSIDVESQPTQGSTFTVLLPTSDARQTGINDRNES